MASTVAQTYRQSYVEKDRCVRNSTAVKVPGVDVMQGFTMSKSEFENVFLQAAENMDDPNRRNQLNQPTKSWNTSKNPRLPRGKKVPVSASRNHAAVNHFDSSSTSFPSKDQPLRSPSKESPEPIIGSPQDAADYADVCRKHAASLQRCQPADYDGAGEFFEKAVDSRAKYGLFCTPENADAHVEYAQNLSKRGLTPEAEYHLRSAADIYRMLDARSARKYGDVLLYMAVVIDRQGRLAEAENFYRSSLAVYRANKLSDDNVRVAIDSLSNNLRAQGRSDEVDVVVRRHFLGALD